VWAWAVVVNPADYLLCKDEYAVQAMLADELSDAGWRVEREVLMRVPADFCLLETSTKTRRVDLYVYGRVDAMNGNIAFAIEVKKRKHGGFWKAARTLHRQVIGAQCGYGWMTQDGRRLPRPTWAIGTDQVLLSGVTATYDRERPDLPFSGCAEDVPVRGYLERQLWANGASMMKRSRGFGLHAHCPTSMVNAAQAVTVSHLLVKFSKAQP
jgi:hypothetical protein